MKFVRTLFCSAFLLIIFSVSSFAFSLQSSEYNSGDTLIAYSEGQMSASSVRVADADGNTLRIGLLSYNAGNTSYVYFDIPTWMLGNYTFYFGQEGAEFSVSNGKALAIRPIVIYTDRVQSNARIDLYNRKDVNVEATITSSNGLIISRSSISIPAASTRNIFVSWNNKLDDAFIQINYDSGKREYSIPVLFISEPKPNESISLVAENKTNEPVITEPTEKAVIKLSESLKEIKHTIPQSKMINGTLHFTVTKETRNARFHLTSEIAEIVTLNITEFPLMVPGVTYEQYVWINRYRNFAEGDYSGTLSLDSENAESANINLYITLTKSTSDIKTNNTIIERAPINRTSFNATSINYTIINYTEEARLEKEKSSRNFRIGVLMIGVLLLIAGLIVYFFRPKNKELSLNEYVSQMKKGQKKR